LLDRINVSKHKISVISTIFLIIFATITGFTPSVIRACIMAELGIISKRIYRKSNMLNNLCIALLITLIINPYNLISTSVLLSYGGVLRNNKL